MGGAAGAGTSGRPFFSPSRRGKGRGEYLMRKVVTGDQVAQLRNPDPLAFPVWRAPVYRTPGWIIAIAQLCRFISWLIRLVVRHPAVSLVLAVARVHLGRNRLARRHPPGRSGPCWSWCAGGCCGRCRSPAGSLPRRAAGGGRGATGAGGRR